MASWTTAGDGLTPPLLHEGRFNGGDCGGCGDGPRYGAHK